ncbi:MAG TPA: nucleotide exchange factor GrpE [Polyangiaceae bacterium]
MPADPNGSNEPRETEAIVDEGEAPEPSKDAPPPSSKSAETPADPLAAAQAEAQRNKEGWLRTAADFDNFRKRTRKELEDARKSGREDLLRALLPVFDNLERALQSAQRASDVKAVADGLTMVQRQFVDALGREGIQRIATVGHPFDPSVHEAIQQVETSDHAPGTVLAEVQPGYTQGERLVRAAMVVVAKQKSGDGGGGEKDPVS